MLISRGILWVETGDVKRIEKVVKKGQKGKQGREKEIKNEKLVEFPFVNIDYLV
jgi:hypothetical protein